MSLEEGELVMQAVSYNNVELLRELLRASPTSAVVEQPTGWTPLHLASKRGQLACVEAILAVSGVDVDVRATGLAGKTPLQVASETGQTDVVRVLVEAGADVYHCDDYGHTALQLAQMHGHADTAAALILAIEGVNAETAKIRQQMVDACIDGDVEAVEAVLGSVQKPRRMQVINGNASSEKSALQLACEHGRSEVVDKLLSVSGHQIIFFPTGDNVLHSAVASQDVDTIALILAKFPYSMSSSNNEGSLPLHWACRIGSVEAIKLMLEAQYAEDNLKYFEDCRSRQTYRFVCDLNATDSECRTPFYLAVANAHPQLVHFLLNFKIELFREDNEPCFDCPFSLNTYASNGRTPLMVACVNGNEDIVRLLLEHGVDVNLPIALTESEIVNLRPTEEVRCAGSGALFEAAKIGNARLVRLLVKKGAQDYDNRALSVALTHTKLEAVSIFLNELAFADNEHRVYKPPSESTGLIGTSTTLLVSSAAAAPAFPNTAVQLNWHGAALAELKTEWLTSAALKFNARLSRNARVALLAITRLDLSSNQLADVPQVVFQLQSLVSLDVSHNVIQVIALPGLGALSADSPPPPVLPCLEVFNLEANFIQTLPPALFSRAFPSLKVLNVAGNRLQVVPPTVWLAPKLRELSLANNEIVQVSCMTHSIVGGFSRTQQHRRRSTTVNAPPGEPPKPPSGHRAKIEGRRTRGKPPERDNRHQGSEQSQSNRVPASAAAVVVEDQDIIRVNAWQRKVQLSNIDDVDVELEDANAAEGGPDAFTSALRVLNLSSNKLVAVPDCLACCCPRLTRLDLSFNSISEIGRIECLPSSLRHLNLSNNALVKGFTLPQYQSILCQAPIIPGTAAKPARISGGNRHSRSRSRSVARNQRSLSVARLPADLPGAGDGGEPSTCSHKAHARFEALRTLNLSHNRLPVLDLFVPVVSKRGAGGGSDLAALNDYISAASVANHHEDASLDSQMRMYLVFPAVTNLDVSFNALTAIPSTISLLTQLAALNVSGNTELETLPYELGLLDRLWNITIKGCPLKEPLKSIVSSKSYKTLDLITFLRNKLENSKPYNKLKLMILGGPGVGKSCLLSQLRSEGQFSKKSLQSESWSRRMGHSPPRHSSSPISTSTSMRTSCVDVAEWAYEPKKASRSAAPDSIGPITFRTWDFDGKQKEYAAICQHFMTRRCIYIVVWKATDGEIAINELREWLLIVQARAPNATVVIVGTHFDAVEENIARFPTGYIETMYSAVQKKFVNVPDADKKGLPRVVASLLVSLKSKTSVRGLCNVIYQAAADLRAVGKKKKLLEQKVPAIFQALEKVVVAEADGLRFRAVEPILKYEDFWLLASQKIIDEFGRPFRDQTEFRQACAFLADNGICQVSDDSATGAGYYFLDPPWLCAAIATVLSTRPASSTSSHSNSITVATDLHAAIRQLVTHTTKTSSKTSIAKDALLRLLYRAEAVLPMQAKLLLLPSSLPDEYLLRADYPGAKIKCRSKASGFRVSVHPDAIPVPSPVQQPAMNSFQQPLPSEANTAGFSLPPKRPSIFHRKIVRTLAAKIEGQRSPKHARAHRVAAAPPAAVATTPSAPEQAFADISGAAPPKVFVLKRTTGARPMPIRRLYALQYIPPGFWPRLITRILDDEKIVQVIAQLFVVTEVNPPNSSTAAVLSKENVQKACSSALSQDGGFEWLLWKSGVEINAFSTGATLLSLKEFLPLASVRDVNYSIADLVAKGDDAQWRPIASTAAAPNFVELFIPDIVVKIRFSTGWECLLELSRPATTRLLAILVNLIDNLLEDWFPALGTRFVHTSEGVLLVDRLIPCPGCADTLISRLRSQKSLDIGMDSVGSGLQTPTDGPAGNAGTPPRSKTMGSISAAARNGSSDASATAATEDNEAAVRYPSKPVIHLFTVEECILQTRNQNPESDGPSPQLCDGCVVCPRHDQISIVCLAPDVAFADLPPDIAISEKRMRRGKLMARGAFGFVFDGFVKVSDDEGFVEVALKTLEPVNPGTGARPSALAAFEAFKMKWRNDARENCARSYCTARQELEIFLSVAHPHITALVGFCPLPMTMAVELAPLGSLDTLLARYRRCDARLAVDTLKAVCMQIAKAVEYLHVSRIIYRDLKSENVLVWRFPLPRSAAAVRDVLVKLGDYGISRFSYPSGVCKGYGGTEGFMAPEIMRANGEQEYDERIDCFSFGMFVYELIALKQPYDGQEQMKDFILDGGRPFLSDKELLVPSNILDTMVACWAEDPVARPSSSQLVSLITAPEFDHLLDVALIDGGVDPAIACLAAQPPTANSNCWLALGPGVPSTAYCFKVLSCSPYGWLESKVVQPRLAPISKSARSARPLSVTTVAAIDDNIVWIGDSAGGISVVNNVTQELIGIFTLSDLCDAFGRLPDPAIRAVIPLTDRQVVLIVLESVVIVCVLPSSNSGIWDEAAATPRFEPPSFLTSIELVDRITATAVTVAHGGMWQIWTGHAGAKVIVHHMHNTRNNLVYSASVNHFSAGMTVDSGVAFIAAASGSNVVWTSLERGSSVFLWEGSTIRKTLDCRKLLPVSESLSSMNVDAAHEGFVTALVALPFDQDDLLVVGTSTGIVIMIGGGDLTPLSSFRPFAGSVERILPLSCRGMAPFLGQREMSVQSLNSITSADQPPMAVQPARAGAQWTTTQQPTNPPAVERSPSSSFSNDTGAVNDYLLDAVSRVRSMFVMPSATSQSSDRLTGGRSLFGDEDYLVVIGQNYRPLLGRFLPTSVDAMDRETTGRSAVVLRATSWGS